MNELTVFAVVTILYTAIAMWITQPSYACVMIDEPRRILYMDLPVHREHLTRDVGRIRQVAARYDAHKSEEVTGPGDGKRCIELLTQKLSTSHHTAIEDVRAAMSDAR